MKSALPSIACSLLLSVISLAAGAQDLSGIWRGHFASGGNRLLQLLGEEDRYKFEVQIDQNRKAFEGVTYSYKTTVFYGKASCSGTFNPATRKVLLEEIKIVEVRMAGGDACIMTCFLQYTKVGNEEFMEGTYTSMNTRDSTNCGKGTIFLRKVPTSDFYKEPFLIAKEKQKKAAPPIAKAQPPAEKKAEPAPNTTAKKPTTPVTKPPAQKPAVPAPTPKKDLPDTRVTEVPPVVSEKDTARKIPAKPIVPLPVPKVLTARANELVKTITTSAREVVINIYDNGTIDNDTISVYLNKKLVVDKERLTESPITFKFNLDENQDEHEVVMVAENLGEIPPNTSLMVVKAGGKQYEVRITSNEQKNAVVIFKYSRDPS